MLTLILFLCHTKSTMKPDEARDELNLASIALEYSDEDKARTLFESLRWPNGATCPHCAANGSECRDVYRILPKITSKQPGRKGLWSCAACRKQFTVTVGTVMEGSHIPLRKWLLAMFLMCSSKKGMSAHQIHRSLKVTYKTAWFLCHRIRFAMDEGPLAELLKGTVEIDETFVGGKGDHKTKHIRKTPVVALIQRDGKARAKVVASVTQRNLKSCIAECDAANTVINTDQAGVYIGLDKVFKRHDVCNHSIFDYAHSNVDGKNKTHVNTCESFFSLLKRGVYGAFHHVSREHLHRYANEFSFRWNHRRLTDGERTEVAIEMVEGKRLKYRQCV
jgi:transposase-like protein